MLRATHDAILVGIGTALADDPDLTCRLPGMGDRSPVRVVLDTHLRLPETAKMLANAADVPVWLIAGDKAELARKAALEARGATVLMAEHGIRAALEALAGQGITRVLVEGGAAVAASLADARLIDAAVLFDVAVDIGPHGIPAGSALAAIRSRGPYRPVDTATLCHDSMSSYLRSR